jgi:hypothetical protein
MTKDVFQCAASGLAPGALPRTAKISNVASVRLSKNRKRFARSAGSGLTRVVQARASGS